MFDAYIRTFSRLGLQAIPMAAATGPIGGDLSHEFIVLADTGESEVFVEQRLLAEITVPIFGEAHASSNYRERLSKYYAATDEKRDLPREEMLGEEVLTRRGIEVGHIFSFGDKYSASMGLKVSGQDGQPVVPQMGSYGIGVSRLVGAIIEASHDDNGIIWPEAVAPWTVGLVTMRGDDAASISAADDIYAKLTAARVETLYDDRDERGGVKLGSMDLIGLPWQLVIGPRGLAAGTVELKNRRSGEKVELSIDDALARLTS
jgi:prolyl-tRNA synthetase